MSKTTWSITLLTSPYVNSELRKTKMNKISQITTAVIRSPGAVADVVRVAQQVGYEVPEEIVNTVGRRYDTADERAKHDAIADFRSDTQVGLVRGFDALGNVLTEDEAEAAEIERQAHLDGRADRDAETIAHNESLIAERKRDYRRYLANSRYLEYRKHADPEWEETEDEEESRVHAFRTGERR
jgi:hypothetical protein